MSIAQDVFEALHYMPGPVSAKANEAAETGAGGACEAKVVPLAHKDGKAAENVSEAVSQDSGRGGFMVVLCRGKLDESIRDAIVRRGFRMAGIDCYHGHSAYHFECRGE